MLVLGRKAGETLVIGGNVRVTILSIDGERVSVGIDAPREVAIVRQELFDAVQAENRQAAALASPTALARLRSALPTSAAE